MKTKKWMKLLAVVTSLGLLASTCGACTQKATDKDEQGRTILSVGNWPTKEGTELNNRIAQKEKFERNNPDVVIKPDEWVFDLQTFYPKAAGGQLPIYYLAPFTEISQIIDAGYSSDITDILKKYDFLDKMNPQILDLLSKEGRVYAFPRGAYILGIALNTDLMKEAGLTEADETPIQPKDWNELAEFAVKIKEATGKPGFIFPTAGKYGGWMLTVVAWSFGVDFMEQDGDGKWKATFDTPEMAEALQYIKDLKWKYDVVPSNTLIDDAEYYKTFATGNAGMLIAAGDVSGKVAQYGLEPEQLGMMGLPAGPKRHVTLLGGGINAFSAEATEEQLDAAMRWNIMTYNPDLTEDVKETLQKNIESQLEDNRLVGIKSMSIWNDSAESLAYEHQLIDEKTNGNPNHVKLYNEFVANCPADIQPEEPVCAQELYGILDGCIQEIFTNENADCADLIKKAASDFQTNYLDNLTY